MKDNLYLSRIGDNFFSSLWSKNGKERGNKIHNKTKRNVVVKKTVEMRKRSNLQQKIFFIFFTSKCEQGNCLFPPGENFPLYAAPSPHNLSQPGDRARSVMQLESRVAQSARKVECTDLLRPFRRFRTRRPLTGLRVRTECLSPVAETLGPPMYHVNSTLFEWEKSAAYIINDS